MQDSKRLTLDSRRPPEQHNCAGRSRVTAFAMVLSFLLCFDRLGAPDRSHSHCTTAVARPPPHGVKQTVTVGKRPALYTSYHIAQDTIEQAKTCAYHDHEFKVYRGA